MRWPAPPHLLLAAYCAGLCAALACRWPAAGVAALGLLGAALVGGALRFLADERRRTIVAAAGLSLLFVTVGVVVGGARLESVASSALGARVGERLDLRAEVVDLPAIKEDQVTLAVRVAQAGEVVMREPAHLRLQLDDGQQLTLDPTGPLVEGAVIDVPGVKVEPLPEAKPGEFDYGRYLRRRGEHALLEADFADLRIVGRRGGLQGIIDRLRLASRAHLLAGVHPPVSDVLQGMVLGDDEGVEPELEEDFRRSGLLHIMAVSGENVVLLCGMWSFAFALLGINRLVRTALLLPVVATYVLLTGASPSIVRAGVAGIMGLLAILASRPSDGWLLWLVPGAWLLTVNPNNLFDVSFQLSFGAVVGLILLARPLTRAVGFLPGPLPEQVGITTAASLSTAPVSMLTFGSASLVSVPANVAGGFVLGPIMFLGMLSLLLGFVSSWLSAPLNVVAGLFIGFLIAVSRFFGQFPGAVYEWQGVSLGLLLTLGLLAEVVAIGVLAARGGEGLAAFVRAPRRRTTLVVVTVAIVAVSLLVAPAPVRPPAHTTLSFLSVGEGSATLVQAKGGPTVLIDAGPSPLARTLRQHAVDRIDLLILSHGHADHVAGLEDVIGHVPVTTALMPKPDEPSEALDEIEAALQAEGTEVRRCTSPVAFGGGDWALDVLATTPPPGSSGNQAENDCALVAVVSLGGRRVLVPGDAEGPVLGALDLPVCDIVGVPHHGSSGGLDAGLLGELVPLLAVISVGENTHGHPTPELLGVLSDVGVPTVRTDHAGEIVLSAEEGGLRVRAMGGG